MTLQSQQETLRELLATNQLPLALDMLQAHLNVIQHNQLQQEIVLYKSQFSTLQQSRRTSTADPRDLYIQQNKLIFALYALTQRLPSPMPAEAWKQSLEERSKHHRNQTTETSNLSARQIQNRLLLTLLVAKLLILGFGINFQQSGGFPEEYTYSLAAILIPSFLAFLGMSMRELNTYQLFPAPLPKPIPIYLLITGYTLLSCILLFSPISFSIRLLLLILVEAVMNVFLGRTFARLH